MTEMEKRAEARRGRITVTRKRLADEQEDGAIRGEAAVSLVHELTLASWEWSGRPIPRLARADLPYRFVAACERR